MLTLGFKYSTRDLICDVITVREAQNCDMRHITYYVNEHLYFARSSTEKTNTNTEKYINAAFYHFAYISCEFQSLTILWMKIHVKYLIDMNGVYK